VTDNRDNDNGNGNFRVVGTYVGHTNDLIDAIEKDENSFVTGSIDKTLRVWNKTTCECLNTIQLDYYFHRFVRMRDGSSMVCSCWYTKIEILRFEDLQCIASFKQTQYLIKEMCELEDGSFILTSSNVLSRWDITNGKLLQTFEGHSHPILKVMELMSDVIVSSSWDRTIKIWRISMGKCVRSLKSPSLGLGFGLVNLGRGFFACGFDNQIGVFNRNLSSLAVYQPSSPLFTMQTLADGSIITGIKTGIELWKP